MDSKNNDGLLRLPQVLELIPVSRATWYAGINSGRFPKPIKFGERISAWKRSEIQELIKKQSAAE